MTPTAYPLAWPAGWRRIEQRKDAAFKSFRRDLSIADGVNRVLAELSSFGVTNRDNIVISTNVQLRLDGLPKSSAPEPADPGAAVYWLTKGAKTPKCMAVDRYTTVADNLAAIAATLAAMRAIERHGGAQILERAFAGFAALPAPEQPFEVLGVGANASEEEIERAFRLLASKHHPDHGGDEQRMARINAARDALLGFQ